MSIEDNGKLNRKIVDSLNSLKWIESSDYLTNRPFNESTKTAKSVSHKSTAE
jgi:hypothetical protein